MVQFLQISKDMAHEFGTGLDGAPIVPSWKKKPSTNLNQDLCLGVDTNEKRPSCIVASQAFVSLNTCVRWLSRIRSMTLSVGQTASTFLRRPNFCGLCRFSTLACTLLVS